jgi:hypothetical protein
MCKHWAAKAEKCPAALVVSVKKLTEKIYYCFRCNIPDFLCYIIEVYYCFRVIF